MDRKKIQDIEESSWDREAKRVQKKKLGISTSGSIRQKESMRAMTLLNIDLERSVPNEK